ncbi:MAG: transposase [Ignavibacteria bacterium]|nr:transposase [Ignavibacteria bacterium]
MNKDRKFYKNTYHHLYNRGANKGLIYFDHKSYLHFLRRLKFYKDKYCIEILSYCLMPNHFHLFVKQKTDELLISDFISSLLNSYVKSINIKYDRSGTLFESKTKSKIILEQNYFMWVIKYILENPVKAKLVKNIEDWEFSNAKDILGLRNGNLTNLNEIKSYFNSEQQMREYLTNINIKVDYEF